MVADSLQVRIEFPDVNRDPGLEGIREMVSRLAGRINQHAEIFVFADEFLKRVRDAVEMYRIDMAADAERLGPEIRRASNVTGISVQLMFVLAAGTIAVAMTGDMKLWAFYVSVVLVGAKVVAFGIQYVAFRLLVGNRLRAAARA